MVRASVRVSRLPGTDTLRRRPAHKNAGRGGIAEQVLQSRHGGSST